MGLTPGEDVSSATPAGPLEVITLAVSTHDLVEGRCPYCGRVGTLRYDHVEGEVCCTSCGYVVSEYSVDMGLETRAFTLEEKEQRLRTGPPISIAAPDKGLSTEMDIPKKSALGENLSPEVIRELYRLRRWDKRIRSQPSERNIDQAKMTLDKFCEKLNIPSYVEDEAMRIYKMALDKGLVRGRAIISMAAASLYAACRRLGFPVRLKHIAKVSVVAYDESGEAKALEESRKEISRCYRLILKETGLTVKTADPAVYVHSIVERASLPSAAEEVARDVIRRARNARIIAGKDPLGVAASAVYIACVMMGEKKTQKEVAKAAGVTEVTIRNRYKDMKEKLRLDLPE